MTERFVNNSPKRAIQTSFRTRVRGSVNSKVDTTTTADRTSSGSQIKSCSSVDHRQAKRVRMLKGGIITYCNRHITYPCTVKDLSDTGARLQVSSPSHIPNEFELIIELNGLEAPCVLAWRNGREAGVKFASKPNHVRPRRTQVVDAYHG